MKLSVIICTHNPRLDYLNRVLDALQEQSFSKQDWELLLIDNASEQQLCEVVNLSWHPNARMIREDELGLTPARLRGIKESAADLLVFCDDDNVFHPNYLEEAIRISETWPTLGAWGGQLSPEFETPPADWTRPYWHLIGFSSFTDDRWSNQYDSRAVPCGAGLCIRRPVANCYFELLRSDPVRKELDRRGQSLMSAGDTDMALTACDLGLGTALFAALRLRHLIPSRRLTLEYLLAMREAQTFSLTILASFRNIAPYKTSPMRLGLDVVRALFMNPLARRFRIANIRGEIKARQVLNRQRAHSRVADVHSNKREPITANHL